jgi:hypothetical protein
MARTPRSKTTIAKSAPNGLRALRSFRPDCTARREKRTPIRRSALSPTSPISIAFHWQAVPIVLVGSARVISSTDTQRDGRDPTRCVIQPTIWDAGQAIVGTELWDCAPPAQMRDLGGFD